jgi:hypothetical protein
MWRNVKPQHLGIFFIGVGFVFMIVGWNGAANVNCVDCQIPYLLSGGFVGLAFIVVGGGLLLFEALRRHQAHLEDRLIQLIDAQQGSANGAAPKTAPVKLSGARSANGMVVIGRSSFHRPDCRLVEGKEDLDYASMADAEERGLSPCRVCDPTKVTASRR